MEKTGELDYIERVKLRGGLIARTIVIVNLLFVLVGFVTLTILDEFSIWLIPMMIWIVFIFSMIYFGRRWAKWLFVLSTVFYFPAQAGLLIDAANTLNRVDAYSVTDEIRAQAPDHVTDEWLAWYLSPYPENTPDEVLAAVLAHIPNEIEEPKSISKGFIAFIFTFAILEIIVSFASVALLVFSYPVNEFLDWQRGKIEHRVNY